ncbi:MAG: exo-alpha-sialidase [Kiritimatiellae bacterium]|nr:exo-alpha-sialidase [Kiritimatiellia bacterium]
MKKQLLAIALAAAAINAFAVSEQVTLWKNGDGGIAVYRIPAICTAPNGDLIAVCDARSRNGGDLNIYQPINISCRRSTDNGATWSDPVNTWTWRWDDEEQWSGSDPSLIVDEKTGTIFLFYNVWEWKNKKDIYQFFVQESTDNGLTWSKPRDISNDIKFDGWNFGGMRNQGGFIFITSGSGVQMKDGTLMHTIVRVGGPTEVALFGSSDHGKTWKHFGNPVQQGDECKFVELDDGTWMINSRCQAGSREVHRSTDKGVTWTSVTDYTLLDPACNAQLMKYPLARASGPDKTPNENLPENVLLFSNCKSRGRNNLFLRTSWDDGKTWTPGVSIEPAGAAYSDMTILKTGEVGVLFEGAGYATIRFCKLEPREFLAR